MKYKSIASPAPWKGVKLGDKKLVVPNQSMPLEEILKRFTRGEPINVGKEAQYDDGPDDLEKMAHMDLVDREEYIDRLKATQRGYEKQEKEKETLRLKRLDEEVKAQLLSEERKKAAEKAPKAE